MSNLIDSRDVLPQLGAEELRSLRDVLPELGAKLQVLASALVLRLGVQPVLVERLMLLLDEIADVARPCKIPLIDPYEADTFVLAGANGATASPGSPV